MLRRIASDIVSSGLIEAPKRAVQTPQREWLRGPLSEWATQKIEGAMDVFGGSWLDRRSVTASWEKFRHGEGDNSYYVWQWINLGLAAETWD
jgi:asparagine synthase (glutamine-hydrolysing)